MIEEKEKKEKPGEDSGEKIEVLGDEKSGDQEPEDREKVLEKMTKKELREKLQELREESAKNYDLYLRSQAEMENLKKRSKKDKEDWVKYANETLIKELLPVMDNLENALSHSNEEDSLHALREGIELTLKGLKDSLLKAGVEVVKAMGEPFDPCFHEAVSEMEDPAAEPGAVIHELQKGYILNQRLIRPAMVVVNRARRDENPTDPYDNIQRTSGK